MKEYVLKAWCLWLQDSFRDCRIHDKVHWSSSSVSGWLFLYFVIDLYIRLRKSAVLKTEEWLRCWDNVHVRKLSSLIWINQIRLLMDAISFCLLFKTCFLWLILKSLLPVSCKTSSASLECFNKQQNRLIVRYTEGYEIGFVVGHKLWSHITSPV